ncbi:MAG: YraN family protein [Clostridia bacterium]|jgi:putative endonuclease|nr:YraN family protein [Clostridia bacterium]MCI9459618.1 YraN family protein [Clostridia bacterium]
MAIRKKRINKNGKTGEDLAVRYLETHGYRVLDRNFTTDVGEVDIFVTDEKTLIAVEVKSRLSLEYGTPAEAVGHEKIKKISQVTAQYIKKFRLFDVPVRFDVVEVYLGDKTVNHIINAFSSYLNCR